MMIFLTIVPVYSNPAVWEPLQDYLFPQTRVSLSVSTGLSIWVTMLAHISVQASILSLLAGLFMRPLTLPGEGREKNKER